MRIKRSSTRTAVIAVILMLWLSACGSTDPATTTGEGEASSSGTEGAAPTGEGTAASTDSAEVPAEYQDLYEAALEDEEFVWVLSSPGGEDVISAFQEVFPGVEGTVLPQSGSETATNLVSTLGAGQTPEFDISFAPPTVAPTLMEAGALTEVDWEALGVNPDLIVDITDGNGVAFYEVIYVLTYNTDLVDEASLPGSWLDVGEFTDGVIAVDPRGVGHGQMALCYENDVDGAYALAEQMLELDLVLPPSSGVREETVSSGNAALGFGDHLQPTLTLQEQGAPVDWIPTDCAASAPFFLYIPTGAENQDAAKLFITWLSSTEGQELVYTLLNRTPPIIEGGFESPAVQALEDNNVELVSQFDFSEEELVRNSELRDRVAELLEGTQ